MTGNRKDYGPAGCMSGCASTMAGMTLLLAALVGLVGLVWRRKDGRR